MDKAAEFVRSDWMDIPILVVLTWGWIRWAKHPQPKTLYSILSLIAFTLGTLSALLAVSSMLYALMIGSFPYYDARLLRIFGWGGVLSIAGLVCAIGGVRESTSLRWHALGLSLGMLLFWWMSAMGE